MLLNVGSILLKFISSLFDEMHLSSTNLKLSQLFFSNIEYNCGFSLSFFSRLIESFWALVSLIDIEVLTTMAFSFSLIFEEVSLPTLINLCQFLSCSKVVMTSFWSRLIAMSKQFLPNSFTLSMAAPFWSKRATTSCAPLNYFVTNNYLLINVVFIWPNGLGKLIF